MSTSNTIRSSITVLPKGAVFSSADFLSVGSRASIDQTLYRMVNAREIVRIARGLYTVADEVDAHTVALAIEKKTGERIGNALLHPSSSSAVMIPTSGISRTVITGSHQIQFRRMSQRKIQLSETEKGLVLLDLWNRGMKDLTTIEIKRATSNWSQTEIDGYAALIPEWLRSAIKQSNEQRKSTKLGLSGAYDWSSTQIKDHVLISKVLEKHKFEDLVRLCLYYGVSRVKRVFRQSEFDSMTSASVARMLKNISKGLSIEKGNLNSPNERGDKPVHQIDFLKSTPKLSISKKGFNILAVDGLFVMKSIVLYDRIKSRDIYDLLVLTRDHGYSIENILEAINTHQPFRDKDPEHFKSAVTGIIPLDKHDEGFSNIHLNVKIEDVYKYFIKLINEYEVNLVKTLKKN